MCKERGEVHAVYYLDEITDKWIKIPDAVFAETSVSFYVNHLTRFTIFKESILPEKIEVALNSVVGRSLAWLTLILVILAYWIYRRHIVY